MTGRGAQILLESESGTESSTLSSDDRANLIGADEGGFIGLSFGYVFTSPVLFVNRVELYGTGSDADESRKSIGGFVLRSVDNNALIALSSIPLESTVATVSQDQRRREFGLRFKSDQPIGRGGFALSAEPFFIDFEQITIAQGRLSNVVGTNSDEASASRRAQIDADFFGAQFAVEANYPVIGERIEWLGRASVGVYSVDAEGRFRSQGSFNFEFAPDNTGVFETVSIKHNNSEVGYRLGGETGVRWRATPWALLSLTGSVDFLSDVPTADLPRFADDRAARVDFDDLTDWRIGVRLTLATQRQAEALK